MADTIITRIGFCPNCYKEKRPHIFDDFLVVGSTGEHHKKAGRNGNWGFTPHIYKLVKTVGANVIVDRACAMYLCGVTMKQKIANGYIETEYFVDKTQWVRQIYTREQWDGLLLWKHDNDYWI